MTRYSCTFIIMSSEPIAASWPTIESLAEFIQESQVISQAKSEIIFVNGRELPSDRPTIAGLRVIGPRDWTRQFENDPPLGPMIVKYFGIAQSRATSEINVLVAPEGTVTDIEALDNAIEAVARDHWLAVISHGTTKRMPSAIVFSDAAAPNGAFAGMSDGRGVLVRRGWFKPVSYVMKGFVRSEAEADARWFIAGTAAQILKRQSRGGRLHLEGSNWM